MRVPRQKTLKVVKPSSMVGLSRFFWWARTLFFVLGISAAWILSRWWYFQSVTPDLFTPAESSLSLSLLSVHESVLTWIGESSPGMLGVSWLSQMALGTSLFAVRIPSFIAGVFLPLALAVVARRWGASKLASVLTALFVAASSWSWHFSTLAEPAHLGLFWWVLAVAVLSGKTSRWWQDLLGAGLLVLSWITYPVTVVFLVALMIGIGVRRWTQKQSLLWGWGSIVGASVFTLFLIENLHWTPQLSFHWPTGSSLASLIDWSFLVSRGGSVPWDGIPGTGYLNGMLLMILAVLGPVLLGITWQRQDKSSLKSLQSAGTIVAFFLTSLFPLLVVPGELRPASLLWLFALLSLVAAVCVSTLWEVIKPEFPSWSLIGIAVALIGWVTWHSFLWVLPAQVRWKYYISPHWNEGFEQVLSQDEVRQAEHVYIVDDQRLLAPVVLLQDSEYRQFYWEEFGGRHHENHHLLGKYHFISASEQEKTPAGVILLRPRSNTEWDIIKL